MTSVATAMATAADHAEETVSRTSAAEAPGHGVMPVSPSFSVTNPPARSSRC